MADTSIPAGPLTAAQDAEAVAPSSLKGWGFFQRSVNVTLPYQLKKAGALQREAVSIMGGTGS